VNTKDNPADDASRGLNADQMTKEDENRWLKGPAFLWKNAEAWPTLPYLSEIPNEDAEVKRDKQAYVGSEKYKRKVHGSTS
jgi:hypothetical protein